MAIVKVSNVPGVGYFLDIHQRQESRLSGPFERSQIDARLRSIGIEKDRIAGILDRVAEGNSEELPEVELSDETEIPISAS
jgi:hypothetical protein